MNELYMGISAFGGAVVSGLLGWTASGEPFAGRKFFATVLRAVLAGATFAVGTAAVMGSATIPNMIGSFLAGAGIDAGLHRIGTATSKKV